MNQTTTQSPFLSSNLIQELTLPSVAHLDQKYLTLPININGKQHIVFVSEQAIFIDSETVIEFTDAITNKTPDVSVMQSNAVQLASSNGWQFGVPNEFWATVSYNNNQIECVVKDRFNKLVVESETSGLIEF